MLALRLQEFIAVFPCDDPDADLLGDAFDHTGCMFQDRILFASASSARMKTCSSSICPPS